LRFKKNTTKLMRILLLIFCVKLLSHHTCFKLHYSLLFIPIISSTASLNPFHKNEFKMIYCCIAPQEKWYDMKRCIRIRKSLEHEIQLNRIFFWNNIITFRFRWVANNIWMQLFTLPFLNAYDSFGGDLQILYIVWCVL